MISQSSIQNVLDAARVEEVIGDFIQLKKSGSNYKGLSPFTDERTPSFMVSPVKQIWKDFSSGKGGNAISFIMEHEHFSYPEAIKYLAKKYNIEIEETEQSDEQKQAASERESMYLVNAFAQEFFINQMMKTDEGRSVGLSYFKERGFNQESIETFKLGYSPEAWQALTDKAVSKGYKLEFLEKTGLSIVKDDKKFDRFRGRVIFPIHSLTGRVLGFGGRILTQDKKAAKYLNSPESEIYHKSKVLYGLYQAKSEIAKANNCFLVEGYTDVIQFHQSGIKNVVSSSGTALTEQQIRLIQRLTPNITVLFDGDEAGIRASLRGIDMILEQGMQVKVCTFPEGEDPDSFAKAHDQEDIETYLQEQSKDFIRYKAQLLNAAAQNDPSQKAEVTRDIINSIAKIPDLIQQELYVKTCADIMQVSEEVLFSTLAQIKSKQEKEARKNSNYRPQQKDMEVVSQPSVSEKKVNQQEELERIIISLLLRYGNQKTEFVDYLLKENEEGELELASEKNEEIVFHKIYMELQEDEIEFTNSKFKTIYELICKHYSNQQAIDLKILSAQTDQEINTEISSALLDNENHNLHRWEDKNIFIRPKEEIDPKEVTQTILNLRRLLIQKKIEELSQSIKDNTQESHVEVLTETKEYKKLEMLISDKIGRVM
ncbi:DNA primase [Mesohalobacter halotolerans]|uniref:DNA primase n=1 Tax=Mesohalobacter halotolerans TaxID=1883405 RepID=A0A4U5TSD8_9FLAO|nr:DNA primase [Mesohalobacter halotolerans]TKS57227.1 DNA primase [Mesohalobacter halotolerans]